MVSSCIICFLLLQSVRAACTGNATSCKALPDSEAILVQHRAKTLDGKERTENTEVAGQVASCAICGAVQGCAVGPSINQKYPKDQCWDTATREWSRYDQEKCERKDGLWCPGTGPREYTQAAETGWCKSGEFLDEWTGDPITLAECKEKCDQKPRCNALIHRSTRCVLKTSCAEIKANAGVVPYIAINP